MVQFFGTVGSKSFSWESKSRLVCASAGLTNRETSPPSYPQALILLTVLWYAQAPSTKDPRSSSTVSFLDLIFTLSLASFVRGYTKPKDMHGVMLVLL